LALKVNSRVPSLLAVTMPMATPSTIRLLPSVNAPRLPPLLALYTSSALAVPWRASVRLAPA